MFSYDINRLNIKLLNRLLLSIYKAIQLRPRSRRRLEIQMYRGYHLQKKI